MTEFIAEGTLAIDSVEDAGGAAAEIEEELSTNISPDISVTAEQPAASTGGVQQSGDFGDDLLDVLTEQTRILGEIADAREQSLFDQARSGGSGGGGGGVSSLAGGSRLASLASGGGGAGLAAAAAPAALVGAPIAAGIVGLASKSTNGFSENPQARNLLRGEGQEGRGIESGQSAGDFVNQELNSISSKFESAFGDLFSQQTIDQAFSGVTETFSDPINEENLPDLNVTTPKGFPPDLGVSTPKDFPPDLTATASETLSNLPTEIAATGTLQTLANELGVGKTSSGDGEGDRDEDKQNIDGSTPKSFNVINNAGSGATGTQTAAESGMETTNLSSTENRDSVKIEDRRRIDVSAELSLEDEIESSVRDAVKDEKLSEREIEEIARKAIEREFGR